MLSRRVETEGVGHVQRIPVCNAAVSRSRKIGGREQGARRAALGVVGSQERTADSGRTVDVERRRRRRIADHRRVRRGGRTERASRTRGVAVGRDLGPARMRRHGVARSGVVAGCSAVQADVPRSRLRTAAQRRRVHVLQSDVDHEIVGLGFPLHGAVSTDALDTEHAASANFVDGSGIALQSGGNGVSRLGLVVEHEKTPMRSAEARLWRLTPEVEW